MNMKKFICMLFSVLFIALGSIACGDKTNDRFAEIYIVDSNGKYEYIASRNGNYVLNNLYGLSLGQDYLLYIGEYHDGEINGVAYDDISIEFDRRNVEVIECDGCDGSYYILRGVSECVGSEITIDINVKGKLNGKYKIAVSFSQAE